MIKWIPAIALALILSRQSLAGDALKPTFDALFSSFIPVDEVRAKPRLQRSFLAVREQLWQAARNSTDVRRMLEAFGDLPTTAGPCGGDFRGSFVSLSGTERRRALLTLQTCPENRARRLVSDARNFYIAAAYGALQETIAGIHLEVSAPSEYIRDGRPALPPSALRYDCARRQVFHRDGVIDYLVVGSGPAGSVLAHELRRNGKRVLLVERGSFLIPGALDARETGGLIDRSTSEDGGILIQNGMGVGGGTTVNIDLAFAPTRADVANKIEGWRRAGIIEESNFTPAQIAAAYAWVKHAIGTRSVAEKEINANNRVLWKGAVRAGLHPRFYDLNTYAPGSSPYPVTDKRSAETELVIPAMQDANDPLSLLPDAEVWRVLLDGDEATGVEIRTRPSVNAPGAISDLNGLGIPAGTSVRIYAKTVILSAGALGSAAILLRSGIANDQIGRGVVLHVSMPVIGRFDQPVDAFRGTRASVFVDDNLTVDGYALECMFAQPVYAALMSPGPALHVLEMVEDYRYLAGFGVMLIDTPSPGNRVTLGSDGEPRIEYTLSDADKVRFRRGISQAIRTMFLAGAKQVYLPTTESLLGGNSPVNGEIAALILTGAAQANAVADGLQFVPNRTLLTSAHMQATDKMGIDPKRSVVSTDFHVWGARSLYEVDAGIFPASIGANPMQSVYTFAKIAADRLNSGAQ